MKRRIFHVATVGSLVLTMFVLMKTGGLLAASATASRQEAMNAELNPYATQSALRYRRCQENHWRACILQR